MIPLEMEVALRYNCITLDTVYTVYTVFILLFFKVSMGKTNRLRVGGCTPLDYYGYWGTCGATNMHAPRTWLITTFPLRRLRNNGSNQLAGNNFLPKGTGNWINVQL